MDPERVGDISETSRIILVEATMEVSVSGLIVLMEVTNDWPFSTRLFDPQSNLAKPRWSRWSEIWDD